MPATTEKPTKTRITAQAVIEHLTENVELERLMDRRGLAGSNTRQAETALAVVKMALAVIKNDLGSQAAESLRSAFNSRNCISH